MKMGLTKSCAEEACEEGLRPVELWDSASPFPQTELRLMPLPSRTRAVCGTLTQWPRGSPNIVRLSPRVGEDLGNKITAAQILT